MTLQEMHEFDHEQVNQFHDPETGLDCIIAVHNTNLGPALGGTRILDYDDEQAALRDALRLSRGMTHKAAAADLPLGGGKAVIMGDPDEVKTEDLLKAYGRAVASMHGRYITAEDVNTEVADMDVVSTETDHVVGLSPEQGGLGDPSPVTAHGVRHGIEAALQHATGDSSLGGAEVLVQGVGKVGAALVDELVEHDAQVAVSDVDEDKLQAVTDQYDVDVVAPDDVYDYTCDVFAPCALGGVINDDTVPQLDCEVVAGSANNVLEDRRHADMLQEHGILYAPDYVINSGGLITVYHEMEGSDKDAAREQTREIATHLADIFQIADEKGQSTVDAADDYARKQVEGAAGAPFRTLSHDTR